MDKMEDYSYLRTASIFAGAIGIAQGVAWFGMSVTGIMAHFCAIGFTGVDAHFGSLLRITLYKMYFSSGSCEPDDIPVIDLAALSTLDLMTPTHVFIWMWVFMLISLLWIASSITMITNVKKSQIRFANVFIVIWISITSIIIIMDFTCFILFTLDYNIVMTASYHAQLYGSTAVTAVLMAAQSASGIMMSVAIRGYLLFIINFALVIYMVILMFKVNTFNRTHETPKQNLPQYPNQRGYQNGHTNNAFVHSKQDDRNAHINAYSFSPNPQQQQRFHNDEIPRVNRQTVIRPVPEKGLGENYQRRVAASTTPDQFSSFHHDDTVLRRDTTNANIVREIKNRNSVHVPNGQQQPSNSSTFQPPIDYSPQTQRAFDNRPPLRSNLRSFRYN